MIKLGLDFVRNVVALHSQMPRQPTMPSYRHVRGAPTHAQEQTSLAQLSNIPFITSFIEDLITQRIVGQIAACSDMQ